MYSELIASITEVLPINDIACARFLQKLNILRASKGQLLLSEGEMCDKLWFVKEGLVRIPACG